MADKETERLYELAELVSGSFIVLRDLLRDLPIPVLVPDVNDSRVNAKTAVADLFTARSVVRDEPIPAETAAVWDRLIVDWITAFEMLVFTKAHGVTAWRLEVINTALLRVGGAILLIEERGSGGTSDSR